MASLKIIIICLFSIVVAVSAARTKAKVKPLSTYFDLCSRRDQKKLNECLKKSITDARLVLKKGVPGLGLIPVDPMVIPRLDLEEGSGNFKLKVSLENFVIDGVSQFNITSSEMNLGREKVEILMSVLMPQLNITSQYEINGQVLVIPIQGRGKCEMRFGDVVLGGVFRGVYVTREGEEFIDINDVKWDFQFSGKSWMWFHNLFNGDERLGNATNAFLNTNSKDAADTFKHLPEGAFAEVFKHAFRNVFETYPVSQLFLDD